MRRFFTILAALFVFVGCSQDDVVTPNTPIEKPTYYASFADAEADSRTYLDENFMLLWHNDDRISLFATTYNEEYAFADATGSNSGAFNAVDKDSYVTGNAISTTYAVYPYNAANAISNSEILTIHFPAEQSYAEDSFGRGANTMVAAAQSSSSKLLPFRNAGGYMVLKLYGENKTVKSIELKGNNEEVISGAATAEAKYGYLPLITMGAEGGKTITLTCQNAVELGATEAEATTFWIVVPPITFEEGFTITVTDADGGTYTKSTSKPTTITRNEIKSMSALAPTFTGETENPENTKPANNEIWYTSTDGNIVEPYDSTGFGANIISNTYENGKGIITFDGEVTKIGNYAFRYCSSLTSITIPNNVTTIGNEAFYSCMNLSSVYCKALVPPTLGEYVFYYWNSDKEKKWPLGCVKYVPNDSLTLYKSTSGWGSSYGYNYDVISTITYTTSDFEVIVADLPIMSNTYSNGVGELIFYGDLGSLSSNVFYKNVNLASFGGAYASADGRSLIVDGILFAIAPYGLSEYSIPSGVHTIIANAFSGCNQLSSITIPQSVTDIKNNAFANCNALSSIICYATTPPTIAEGVFTCDSATFYINVPQDYIADYIADPYWSIYESYILAISDRSKYEIGDLVSYNGSEGVVFFVSETVVMLLSTDRTTSNWGLYGTKIGAEDSYNGRNNVIVAKEKGYFNSLPHFVWCENYGDGWYLPASGELKLVRSVYSTISETMTNNGFEGIDGYYRSSTEYGYFDALIVSLTSESTGAVSKNDIYNVRAITAF
ncbi:MAG: leucine-rich repeat protein [Alistipes sp.]|nr:leucine-rich repeat protein [Alistipes sp.]